MTTKWNEKAPYERRESVREFLESLKGMATTLIALTFFVREVGKK